MIGHNCHFYPLCKHYGYLDGLIRRVPLEEVVRRNDFDMIIPVTAQAVATVAAHRPELAALPSAASLECCFDKSATLALAERLDVPAPKTAVIRAADELAGCTIDCPCVVKPVCEVEMKGVFYVRDDAQRRRRVGQLLARARGDTGSWCRSASPAAERASSRCSTTASPSAFSCTAGCASCRSRAAPARRLAPL